MTFVKNLSVDQKKSSSQKVKNISSTSAVYANIKLKSKKKNQHLTLCTDSSPRHELVPSFHKFTYVLRQYSQLS